jgi:Mg-chelatase subunit ChlD
MKPPSYENDPEARITALLLGELNPTQAEEVRSAISRDPELAALHDRLKRTIAFVRAVIGAKGGQPAQGDPTPADPSPRLSDEKRQALLEKLKVVPMKPTEPKKQPERQISWWVGIAAIFVLLGLLAVLLMPNFTRARTQAHSNAVVNNLRQIDGAKQQWALENKKSPDDVPTWTDLQPYLGREGRQVPSVRGEEYVLGQVAEPPVATVGGETKYTLDDGRERSLASLPTSGVFQGSVADSRSDVVEQQVASARFGMATQPEPADRRYYFRGLAESAREGGGAGAGGQGGFGGGGWGVAGRNLWNRPTLARSTAAASLESAPTLGDMPTVGQHFQAGDYFSGFERYADAGVAPATAPTEADGDESIVAGYASLQSQSPTPMPDRSGGVPSPPDGARIEVQLDALAEAAADDLSRTETAMLSMSRGGRAAGQNGNSQSEPRFYRGASPTRAPAKGVVAPPAAAPVTAKDVVVQDGKVTRGATVNFAFAEPPVDEQTIAMPEEPARGLEVFASKPEPGVVQHGLAWSDYDKAGNLDLYVANDSKQLTGEAFGRTRGSGTQATPEAESFGVTSDYAFDVDTPAPAGQVEARKRIWRAEPAAAPVSAGAVVGKSVERAYGEAAGTEVATSYESLAVNLPGPEMEGVALRQSSGANEEVALGLGEVTDLELVAQLEEPEISLERQIRANTIQAEPQAQHLEAKLKVPALTQVEAEITSEKGFVDLTKADGIALDQLEQSHEVEGKFNDLKSLAPADGAEAWYFKSANQAGEVHKLEEEALELARVVEAKPAAVAERLEELREIEFEPAEFEEREELRRAQPKSPAPVPQPEVATSQNPFSTFSLNVTDVSFKLARASLEQGQMPEPASIRSEEFINAFEYHDPEPSPGRRVGVAWERTRYPFAHNRDLLRFGVQTAAQGREMSRPLNVVLCVDNSGSMERADRVAILHEAMRVLGDQLHDGDRISVVAFARTARLWVDGMSGGKASELPDQLGRLNPEGGTNLEDALDLAYATARRHFVPSGINRVVLLTDGAANLGNVDPEALRQSVIEQRKNGIALDSFGVGWEGYNDDLLETLSRNGDGRYGFLNSPEDASTEFADQLAGALRVAASDVKVQVEFNPRRVKTYRQIGYAKHQLTKEQFRDNTVDAAEIGAAESGNALYVVETDANGVGPVAVVRVRFKVPETGQVEETEWMIPYEGPALDLVEASPAIRLAATASAFSEWLAGNPYAAEVRTPRLLELLRGVPEVYDLDPRPKQLEWMIRQAGSIAGK